MISLTTLRPQVMIKFIQIYIYISRFEFHLWVETLILYQSLKIPNLSHYKMMVLNLQRITEHDNMTLLQNEDWFFIMRLLEGGFPPLQNEDWFFIIKLLEGDTPPLQNEDGFLYVFIIRLLEGNTSEGQTSLATKWDWVFYMLSSDGQILLLQNNFRFLKGLSTTETLTTYKMQFPSCGYKMPGPSPFVHLNLNPEMPLKRGTRPPIL